MWISDAPKYISGDINSTNTVCDFIDKYITSENDVELAKYQIHHHTHSCRRRLLKKFKDVGAARKKSKYILAAGESCRFQIPYPPMRTTRVLEPLPRGSKEDTKRHRENYEIIKRRLEDIRIESAKAEPPTTEEFMQQIGLNHKDYIDAIRHNITRPTVFLRREPVSAFVCPYNKRIAECWAANTDLQVMYRFVNIHHEF